MNFYLRWLILLLLLSTLLACGKTRQAETLPTPAASPTPAPLVARPGVELARFHSTLPLVIHFSAPMDPESTRFPLTFSPTLQGKWTWSDDLTTLTFVPRRAFRVGQRYHVALHELLRGASGEAVSGERSWSFQVQRPPTVKNETPQDPKDLFTQKDLTPTFRLLFNRPMDQASVAAALVLSPTVPLRLRWEGQVLLATPERPLRPERYYTLILAASAMDAEGIPLTETRAWPYQMPPVLKEVQWPTSRGAPLLIRFNYAMNTQSVQQALWFTPPITGQWQWDATGTQLTLTPTEPLQSDTAYTMRFTHTMREARGAPLTQPPTRQHSTPPPILLTQPQQERELPPTAPLKVTFDRPMDPWTTEAAFRLDPPLPGSFEWRETTLVFTPEEGFFSPHTNYTLTIGTEALDEAETPVLREPYVLKFRTSYLEHIATFGYGPNAQVLDAAGRRALQYQLYHPGLLRFELYQLTPEQFLTRYASGFRGVAESEKHPISREGATLVQQWEVDGRAEGTTLTTKEILLPEALPPGLYLLHLSAGGVSDQLLVLLTHHVVTLKQVEGQIVAWVTDINGGPVADIEVGVYARDGTLLREGRTDENGLYRTEVERDPQPLIVLARDGDDISATGLSNEWRTGGDGWWSWWRVPEPAPQYAAHLHTDRPIYRPGQRVSFKALLRAEEDAQLRLPPVGTPLLLRIRDARNNVVRSFELTTNEFGTAHGTFDLAEGAVLGEYALELVIDEQSHRQRFKVEEYRKPDYQVMVSTDAPHYLAGDTISVTVDSRYFFGEPVANATLSIRQYHLGIRYRDWWDTETESEYIWYGPYAPEIQATTDAEGRATFTLDAGQVGNEGSHDWPSSLRYQRMGIEVTVSDGSQQQVSGFAVATIYSAAEKLTMAHGSYFQRPGQPFTVEAAVETLTGDPVANRALTLELRRYSMASSNYETVGESAELTTGADGTARLPFIAEEPGYYQLRLSGADHLGHPIEYESWIYNFSDARLWDGRDDTALRISAEQPSYAPGDTARLLVESTFSGPALLTFERGRTRREQLVQLTSPLTVIEVPIQPDDAPNIFVTIHAWMAQDTTLTPDTRSNLPDSRLHSATTELLVPVMDRALTVTITPDKSEYAPREEARFTLRVTDGQGQPVSAELSLALVDEAIFALSEELSGPLQDAFYARREHRVRTYDGLALWRYMPGDRGGGGGGGDALLGNPRSDFPDTAMWLPTLHTDANGEASLSLTLPDSLTTWRLTARALTAEDAPQVGEAMAKVLTRQEIVVRPLLPHGLTAGDSAVLSAFVHNESTAPREVEVWLALSDTLQLRSPLTHTLTLDPDARQLVSWTIAANAAGEAGLTILADADEGADAVHLALPVRPLAVPEVESQIGEFSGEFASTITLPEEALALGSVHIELSRSIAGTLLTGLEYLTGYPYGCVEQTMSRALPNAVVSRAFHQLGVSDPTVQAELPQQINAGIQRLYGYQHPDGGWGWWFDDRSDDYQTAWVVFGLALTAEAGHEVDPAVIERGADWLKQRLPEMEPRTRAFALYSLAVAGHGDLALTRPLLNDLEALDAFSQAALALALHDLGDRRDATRLLAQLAEQATGQQGRVYWEHTEPQSAYDYRTMASSTRSTALILSAFVQMDPEHELVPGIVRWLMEQRRPQGWGSTNETSFALLALSDYLLASNELGQSDAQYEVILNGQPLASGRLGRGEPMVALEIPASQLRQGDNQLRIRQIGGGRLYYVINQRFYLPQESIEAAGAIHIERRYLDPKSQQVLQEVEAGQLVVVQLTVAMPRTGSFIIVEDRLPGGLEALNERLNTTSRVSVEWQSEAYHWEQYGYNHKEVHGDRVSFFITELEAGTRTFTYLARATHTGRFAALPAEAYAMYDLTFWGRSASTRLEIGERARAQGGRLPQQALL